MTRDANRSCFTIVPPLKRTNPSPFLGSAPRMGAVMHTLCLLWIAVRNLYECDSNVNPTRKFPAKSHDSGVPTRRSRRFETHTRRRLLKAFHAALFNLRHLET